MGQLLPEGIKNIQEAVSDRLLRVTARGSLGKGGKIEFAKEPVPGLVDPVKRLLNGQPKQGGLMNKPAEK
jgi:hypothetical protein